MRDPLVWLFNDFDGLTRLDNLKVFMVKFLYVGLRVLLRVLLGKNKRDQLYVTHKIDFGVFWYKANKYLGSYSSNKLLRFKSRKYDYKFYCRNNKDDFKIMTIHEDEIIDKFTPKTGDTVIDVGAHLGVYTIIASRKVGLKGKVISIEADPGNFEILNQNIIINQLENVTALNFAAYSKEEELKLYLQAGESGFTKYNTVMEDFCTVGEKFVLVKARALDDLLDQIGVRHDEVNWVKID